MRVLVCGSRDWDDPSIINVILDGLEGRYWPFVVIAGGAKGADKMAADWQRDHPKAQNWVFLDEFPADWNKHGKAAGPIRNQRMLDEGRPDLVLAFKDNFNWKLDRGGTEDMVKRAKTAGVPAYVISRA